MNTDISNFDDVSRQLKIGMKSQSNWLDLGRQQLTLEQVMLSSIRSTSMPDSCETYKLAGYFHNLMQGTSRRSLLACALTEWVESDGECLGLIIKEDDSEPNQIKRGRRRCSVHVNLRRPPVPQEIWDGLSSAVKRLTNAKWRPGRLDQNLVELTTGLGLDILEQEILRLSIGYRLNQRLESLLDQLFPSVFRQHNLDGLIAKALGVTRSGVTRRLRPDGALIRSGLLTVQSFKNSFDSALRVGESVLHALLPPNRGLKDFRASIFGKPHTTSLQWDDFDHLRDERDTAASILDRGLATKESGLNILVYGPSGTGKTELCKVLAARLGAKLYAVGESGTDGDEPTRSDRLDAFRLAGRLLTGEERILLLFDEMEDFISGLDDYRRSKRSHSRVFMHRLLETNPLPVLWTCNDIDSFDPALLRRMTMAIEVKVPPPVIRERVWNRVLQKEKLHLSSSAVARLARDFEAPPALAASAVRAARLAGGGEETVRRTVRGIAKAMRGGKDKPQSYELDRRFDAALINADVPLAGLADRLALEKSRQFSFCLSGPPGTGKSAWARHLATRLGVEVLHKRASDLLSMWLGESEKNIAAAFTEAAETNALLIFDEADSLLADRRGAQQSWEISQVNEMLTWMEVHQFPFVCTTNLASSLDVASLRRFTFKVQFDYLRPEQTEAAFRTFFGMEAPPAVRALSALTPADFAVVHRKAKLLGHLIDPSVIAAMLEAECRAKPEAPRPIGFRQ